MNIRTIVAKMTLSQKIRLLTGKSMAQSNDIPEMGIPSMYMADGSNGVRVWEGGKATCYPTSSALSATWNVDLAEKVGEYLGDECIEKNVDMLLSPGINIKRDSLCGRNFEYYSEDPILTAKIGGKFIDGVQKTGTKACVKHYAAYNSEYGSIFGANVDVDERTLREIYMKAFEIIVKNNKPAAIMCSYNRLNGIFASENKYLYDVLRKDWKYEGLTLSDWGAVHNKVNSLNAGLQLEMPNSAEDREKQILEALDKNYIEIATIDNAVESILKCVLDKKTSARKYSFEDRRQLAKEVALESITLLKNENELPLDSNKKQKILIVGELAKIPVYQGGGCAYVTNDSAASPYDEILKYESEHTKIEYVTGYKLDTTILDGGYLNEASEKAAQADRVIMFVGNCYNSERETFDRTSLSLPSNQLQILDYILRKNNNVIVVIQAGSAVDMRLFCNRASAIIFQWYSGECGSEALAEILFGKANPSGKLGETFPLQLSDNPSHGTYMVYDNTTHYSEGLMVGYRYYEQENIKPLYPFGHGLSYTQFEYSDLNIIKDNEKILINFMLKNTGNVDGMEIVQLYFAPHEFKTIRAKKELIDFTKISLKSKEFTKVCFSINIDAFAVFNVVLKKWHTYGGEYKLLVGSSSTDIRLTETVQINNDNDL